MAEHARNVIMTKDAVFIYSDELLGYRFSDDHPFNQTRLTLTMDLLKGSAVRINRMKSSRHVLATEEELAPLNHDAAYIKRCQDKRNNGQLLPRAGRRVRNRHRGYPDLSGHARGKLPILVGGALRRSTR